MRKKRFTRKKRVVYEARKLVEYYKIADKLDRLESIPIVKCTYSGGTFVMYNGKFKRQTLRDYPMPFITKVNSTKNASGTNRNNNIDATSQL
jgi:hypothetical protein